MINSNEHRDRDGHKLKDGDIVSYGAVWGKGKDYYLVLAVRYGDPGWVRLKRLYDGQIDIIPGHFCHRLTKKEAILALLLM